MKPLIRLDNVTLSFGGDPLLNRVDLTLHPGRRIALIGRNGTGKSSLMALIAGDLQADDGGVWRQPGTRIAMLQQPLPEANESTVWDHVAEGLGAEADLIKRFHALLMAAETDAGALERLGAVQQELEAADAWMLEQRVEQTLTRLDLPADRRMGELSGGWRRRAALAQALVSQPDLLLLDEPTNHLDILAIGWLEQHLRDFPGSLLFVTHDRAFLKALATDILDLDRGQLTLYPGDYERYERERARRLQVEAEHNAQFDRRLAQEEAWIRQGIKARRTRNEGRVRALKKLREERAQRREQEGRASFAVQDAALSGKLVVEAEGISLRRGDWQLQPLDLRILRGDKLALLGPNGCGKTTLLRLLLGELQPDAGRLRLGTNLEVAYFDQQRETLKPDETPMDYVGQGREVIDVGGRQQHVISYLADFLFSPAQARAPIAKLSGGESNRLMLARLFSHPANVLVLDEPTNDLDLETLELLEDRLVDYSGTVLLVSHDRDFVDQVATGVLAFEAPGVVREYVGGYWDWLRQGGGFHYGEAAAAEPQRAEKPAPAKAPAKAAPSPRKLGYKQQRELEALPERIEALERELEEVHRTIADSAFYRGDAEEVRATLQRLSEKERELERAMARWEELENQR